MADASSNQFELERRALIWGPLTTLNDKVTSLGYDGDPNNVVQGNSDGEDWLYGLPVGQFYKQSNATLWWKTGSPNTWQQVDVGGGLGGDVSKVGTPVDNQVGVWTGDGTIEGTSGLTYSGTALDVTGNITLTGTVDGINVGTDVAANTAKVSNATHTGDVTGATALTIADDAVTYAKMQNVAADDRILGNVAGAGAAVAELTAAQVRTMINVADGATAVVVSDDVYDATGWNANADPATKNAIRDKIETMDSAIALNTAKETNATHTGDVTGSTELTIAAGAVDIAMHSASGTPDATTFLRGDNTWSVPAGAGDVSKVGTPVDNQVGVWTGDGTIEGTSGLTYSGTALDVTGNITLTGTVDGVDIGTDVPANTAKVSNATHTGDVTGSTALTIAADAVTYAKMQNVVADNVLLGNNAGAGGAVAELSASAVRTILNVEDGADVTDATNVDAAGATMNSDTSLVGNSYFLDEDNMVSDDATKVASQQSIKAYVDSAVTSAKSYQGGYNAATNTPDLDTSPSSSISAGDVYDVTAAGTFFTIDVEVGDMLTAKQDSPTLEAHWVVVQANLTPASIKTQYESNANTNAYTDAEQTKVGHISVTQAVDLDTMESNIATNNAKVTNATHTGDVTGDTALTIAAGAVDIAMLSATGTPDGTTFLRGDNTWSVPAGSGDVSKVGTPADNQVGVWTGDGTIEGTSGLTYSGTTLAVTGDITVTGTVDGINIGTDVAANTAKVSNATHTGDVTGSTELTIAAGAVDIAMFSASGTPDGTTFLRGDNVWSTTGDVYKVGTPVDNQVAVWTGDGTVEGDANFTWNGTTERLGIGGVSSASIHISRQDTTNADILLQNMNNANNHGSFTCSRARGTEAAPTVVQANDILGNVAWAGCEVNGIGNQKGSAYIYAVAEGTWALNTRPTYLSFRTSSSTVSDLGIERLRITGDGRLSTGSEPSPDCSPGGLTLNQGASDGWVFTLKSSDVAHPFTGSAETDTYGVYGKASAAYGGIQFTGYTATGSDVGASINARVQTPATTETTSSKGNIHLVGLKTDGGTGAASLANTDNLFSLAKGTAAGPTTLLVKGSGDILQLAGGYKLSSWVNTATAGAIQWDGSNFQGYDGASWVNLDSQAGSAAGSDGQIQYNNGGAFGGAAQLYYADANDRIGLRTAAPGWDFEVYNQSDSIGSSIGLRTYSNTSSASNFIMYRGRGTSGSPTALLDTAVIGAFYFQGHYDASNIWSGALIKATATENWSASAGGTAVSISTIANGSTTLTEKYTFTGNGDLKLLAGGLLTGEYQGTATAGAVEWDGSNFRGYDGAAWVNLDEQAGTPTPAGSDTQIQYNNGGALGADANFVWNDTSEYLGLGTTSPGWKVDARSSTENAILGARCWNSSGYMAMLVLHSGRGSEGAANALIDTSPLGQLFFQGQYDASNSRLGARIFARAEEDWGSLASGTGFEFETTAVGTTTCSKKFTMTGDGDFQLSAGGLLVGGYQDTAAAGAIDWNGSNFRGYNGSSWVNLDSQGSATNPGGSDGQIQYNNGSAFGGTAGAYWDDVNSIFVVGPSDYADAYDASEDFQIVSTSNASFLMNSYGNQGSGSAVVFNRFRGTFTSPTTVASGDSVFTFASVCKTSASLHPAASIACIVTGTVTSTVAPTMITFKTNDTDAPSERLRITHDGALSTGGETAPDVAPGGICLNTGSNTAPFISFKNSTVAHPFTSIRETDTVMMQGISSATNGGALFRGFSESTEIPLKLEGYQQTATTGDASGGAITLIGKKSNGTTGATAYADTENCVSIFNDTTGIAFVKGSGDIHLAGGIKVGLYDQADAAGAIQWDGSNFQGYTGAAWVDLDAQAGSAAGTDGQIQYNNGSAFGGAAGAYWDDTNSVFVVGPSDYADAYDASETVQIHSTSNSSLLISSYGNQASGSAVSFHKARGTFASPATVVTGDAVFSFGSVCKTSSSLHATSSIVCSVVGTVTSTVAPTALIFKTNDTNTPAERFRITEAGALTTGGETAPDTAPGGLCLNVGSSSSPILTWKHSELTHPFTGLRETDTAGMIGVGSATEGGALIRGYSESTTAGITFQGYQQTALTGDNDYGVVRVFAYKSDGGTSVAALADTENCFSVASGGTVVALVKGSGDLLLDGGFKIGLYDQADSAGAVQWDGTNFQGYDGSGWVDLDHTVAGSNGQIQYNDGGVFGGAAQFYYDDTNHRLGLRESSPTWPVELVNSSDTEDAIIGVRTYSNTDRESVLVLRGSRGTKASPLAVQTDHVLGKISFDGQYDATQHTTGATISVEAAENWSDGNAGTSFNIYTAPIGSAVLSKRYIFTGDGDLQMVSGGMLLKDYQATAAAGAIEWSGTNFRGYDGSAWINLDDPYKYQEADNLHGDWFEFDGTFTRTADTTFTVTDNATNEEIFAKGTPLRFRGTGNQWSKYAIVTGYSSGTVTISGGTMTTSDDDEMWFGSSGLVKSETFHISGTFGDGTSTGLLASDENRKFRWPYGPAAIVRTIHIVKTNDSGATEPTINIKRSGNDVYTSADSTDTAWQTFGTPDHDEYGISMDDSLDISCASAGTNKDAADLTVIITFVMGEVYVVQA